MNNYIYSAKNNAFYAVSLKDSYEAASSWPDDGREVSNEIFTEFTGKEPDGKVRGAGSDGFPAWVDIPPPSKEELIAHAEINRELLLKDATAITADWRTELALDSISDDDKQKLTLWMAYIKAVKAVDASKAPDVNWPVKPAE